MHCQAQEVALDFYTSPVTVSVNKLATDRNAQRRTRWPCLIIWTFPDDSRIEVTGRGAHHKLRIFGPDGQWICTTARSGKVRAIFPARS